MLNVMGVPSDKINTVCSSIDKMDNQSIEEIEEELVKKGLDEIVAYNILKTLINLNDESFILEKTKEFNDNKMIQEKILLFLKNNNLLDENTFNDLEKIFRQLKSLDIIKHTKFKPSLARGLDYYTGLIYEVTYKYKNIMPSSIAAGGRYDNMIEKLSNKGKIPSIGISFGVERIVTILESQMEPINPPVPKVYISSVGKDMSEERLKLCLELRKQGVIAETSYSQNPKMRSQFKYVFDKGIPYMIVIGEDELARSSVKIKNIELNKQEDIPRNKIIEYITK